MKKYGVEISTEFEEDEEDEEYYDEDEDEDEDDEDDEDEDDEDENENDEDEEQEEDNESSEDEQSEQNNNTAKKKIKDELDTFLKQKLNNQKNILKSNNHNNIKASKSNPNNGPSKPKLPDLTKPTASNPIKSSGLGKSGLVKETASGATKSLGNAAKSVGNAASGAVKAVGSAISKGIAALLSNPYVLLVIGIIILVIIIIVLVVVFITSFKSNDEDSRNTNGACTINVGGIDYSNIKVRLLDCTSGEPIEGEALVDFDKYVLGVAYAETEGFEAEAIKVEALAAKSYALRRPDIMGGAFGLKLENEDGQSILSIRNCTSDQVYCDPDVGCWANNNNTGNTVHSGKKEGKKQYKTGLSQDSEMRQAVSEIHNKILTQSDGNIYYATYKATNQNEWNDMAKSGSSYEQIVAEHYPEASISTLSCASAGNGNCLTSTPIKINDNEKFNITSPYGSRISPTAGASTFHRGIDLGYVIGTPIYSIFDGEVTISTDNFGSGGKAVIIDHDLDGDGKTDYQSHYYHMSKREVSVGDKVVGGQEIGKVGSTGASTGPHLHFGIKGNEYIDPEPVLLELREHNSIFDKAEVCTTVEGGPGNASLGSYYYNQGDYSDVPYCPGYSDGATIQTSGCFVGSLSIAIANLYDRDSSVRDMAAYICENKRAFRPMGSGTDSNLLYEKDFQELFKFNVETLGSDARTVDNIINYLSQGYRIMVSVKGGHFNPSGGGHYIELDATNGSEIYVYDTGEWKRNGWYDKSKIQSEIINHVNTGMWVIKKR